MDYDTEPRQPSRRGPNTQRAAAGQVSPGKVTRTNKLPPAANPSVPRRPVTSAAGASPPRSAWELTNDPWMDVAHRGRMPTGAAVQTKDDADAHIADHGRTDTGGAAPSSVLDRARAIHDGFHGSLLSEDEDGALRALHGLDPAALRRLRSTYQSEYGATLEHEFSAYCDDAQATEAVAILWPAIPVVDRLRRNTGLLDDNEDGMMDVLRTATRAELAVAAADPGLLGLLDELSDDQQYQARRLIWPERRREHALWRIERAHGRFDDDEDAVYSALLDLGADERRALWDQREQRLSFLGADELALVERMCVDADGAAATDATALDVRMEIATAGLGTDDDAVALVVGRAASLAEEETRLRAALDTGVTSQGESLSIEQRAAMEARLAEIGGVHETLVAGERDPDGELDDKSFLGRLHDDVGAGEYQAFATTIGVEGYERAKQKLLDAVGVFDDDEQAVYDALRDLRAPPSLPPGRTAADYAPDELVRMRAQATHALRARLRADPELAPVWAALSESERGAADAYIAGDTYAIAVHELDQAQGAVDIDEARIVRVVAAMSSADRARMVHEQPSPYRDLMADLDPDERALVREVFATGRVPTERALAVAMGGDGDGTDEALLFDSLGAIPDHERRGYRLGYWLHRQGRTDGDVHGEAERAALARFTALHARLDSELDDEDLDTAMERLIGLPAPEDFLSPEGRRMAAEIMAYRHRERLAMSGGLSEAVSSTDETVDQAALIYDAHLHQLLTRGGDISLEDFSVLVGLDTHFGGRFDEYRASVELIGDIAGTVVATVAAVVIVILSEGTLAPAAAELISSSGGAALWAAVAGAGARVSASEAFGGDFHQTMSSEGARNALIGAIEGATAVASATLAARAAEFVGLGQRALSAEIARAAVDAADTGLALSGRAVARGALEGAIDGFVSGAVGDLVMTATDADTWRRAVWDSLGELGIAVLRGGGFGMAGGAAVGGAMHGAGALVRGRGAVDAVNTIDAPNTPDASKAGRSPGPRSEPRPTGGAAASPPASGPRTGAERAALNDALPPELRGDVAIVDSDAIEGAGVQVVYKDGALRIEVGPEAQPRHVAYHVSTARHLLKYQGPLGTLRRLLDALLTKLRLTPGYGTRGFEARQEVRKLLEIEAELHALRTRLDGRVRALQAQDDLANLDPRQLDRELADIQEQLEYHQQFIDCYEPGRGFVAAGGHGRPLPEVPVAKSQIYEVITEDSNRWKVEYRVTTEDGQDIWLGDGIVGLDEAGLPVEFPHFVLFAATFERTERAVRIYDEVVDGVATGERHSLTRHAIETLERRYTARFGHPPQALKGTLEWSNKLNFQVEYYRLTKLEGLPQDEAALAAIKRISFGQHRAAAGYDDFTVEISGWDPVNLPGYGTQKVPTSIHIVARKNP